MFQTPHHVIVKPNLLLILMTLFTPRHWTLINNDLPVSGGNVAELAQVAGSKAPNQSWVFSFDPDRRAGTNCVSIPLINKLYIPLHDFFILAFIFRLKMALNEV